MNGSSPGSPISTGFPLEWELDLDKDGNGNGSTTTWEWGRLVLVWSQNHSRGSVKSHYSRPTLCALCLRLSHKGPPCDLFLSSLTQQCFVRQRQRIHYI